MFSTYILLDAFVFVLVLNYRFLRWRLLWGIVQCLHRLGSIEPRSRVGVCRSGWDWFAIVNYVVLLCFQFSNFGLRSWWISLLGPVFLLLLFLVCSCANRGCSRVLCSFFLAWWLFNREWFDYLVVSISCFLQISFCSPFSRWCAFLSLSLLVRSGSFFVFSLKVPIYM